MPHKRAKRSVREKNRSESGANLAPGARRAIEDEGIPKSVARVLNAAKVQQEWAERKRKGADDSQGDGPSRKRLKRDAGGDSGEGEKKNGKGKGKGTVELRIMPGESMAHFNRRVEDSMRPSVREAMLASSARTRQVKREELAKGKAAGAAGASASSKSRGKGGAREKWGSEDEGGRTGARETRKAAEPRDFEKVDTSAPKRLNDVVEAPPELKKLPRKAKKLAAMGGAGKGTGASSLKEGVLSMAQKAMMEEERERVIRLYREMKKGKTVV
ncbi:hypothetical protein GSI_07607 [Ganoderma sinense ZZ0214-1]|uniref:Uncharacterized protein n=1 Tax=Ganoderma sinense ZZ0214-1 TaxID=1077348 RepID=A0A2G8S9H9_9APHY|nr:hypothetical protein GSI_07607 [Ganoderma sinense ZZ0214-1]